MSRQLTQTVPQTALPAVHVNGRLLQRKCNCGSYGTGECDKCRNETHSLQRRAVGPANTSSLPPIVDEVLSSSGQALDAGTRGWSEPRFGQDFGKVRVHTDTKAAESAQAVNAEAYTVGNDVVFGAGQHAPETYRGQRLMAHELTHVLQQSGSSPSQLLRMGEPDSAAEDEADQVSTEVMRGGNLSGGPSPQSVSLQRQATGGTSKPSPPAPSPQANPQPARSAADISFTQSMRLGHHGNFDAELDRRAQRRSANEPCQLTLTIRAAFNFRDTETPNRWTPAEENRWQTEFIRAVTNRWSFRFLLAPAQACASEPCQQAVAIVHVEPVTSSPHHTINVFYDKPSDKRSGVGQTSSTLYRPDVDRSGSDLRRNQATATHEAGHMLGVGHVHCDTGADECYGTNREESADVMGTGEIVTERDYLPFVTALQELTNCTWRVRDGQRGPLFGNTSTGLAITLGATGALVGGVLGASGGLLGGILGAVGGGVVGALVGYGVGQLFD